MAETSGAKKPELATPVLEDRISALPDGVLEHILGFLPAHNAVQTSVLARRWRHMWRSMRRLRLTGLDTYTGDPRFRNFMDDLLELPDTSDAPYFRNFIHGLLRLRNTNVALDEVELKAHPYGDDSGYFNICIQQLLFCQAKVLAVDGTGITLDSPLLSQHLRRLALHSLNLEGNSLDFERCPALEDLRITDCKLVTSRILTHSVKYLRITHCFLGSIRAHICAPSLVSLQLCRLNLEVPLLESMPSLETAFLSIGPNDYCDGASIMCSGSCLNCFSDNRQKSGDILGALSNATKLELKFSFPGTLILRRRCPTFSRLKALRLQVPGQANDLHSLVCMLQHSPVLENLTLQLSEGYEWTGESEGRYYSMDQLPVISEHLNTVEIKCVEVDERVFYILKFLGRFIKHININLDGAP